ncbi:hypothetical protein ACWERV_15530 [Streptomyces sp. NPDC004031]
MPIPSAMLAVADITDRVNKLWIAGELVRATVCSGRTPITAPVSTTFSLWRRCAGVEPDGRRPRTLDPRWIGIPMGLLLLVTGKRPTFRFNV